MPTGGEITIVTEKKSKQIVVTITDNGNGMSEETKLKIFQPFYSTKGFELGRGLGMSGVYGIIKEHEGNITIKESELNKGTTLEISFPIIEQKKPKKEKEAPKRTLKNSKELRVLWVEDEKILQAHSRMIVESLGHQCDIAENGESALEYLSNKKYDIVITDIGMPKMNGWELVSAIKNKFGEDVNLAVVSGWSVDKKEREKHGVKYSLDKPFNASEFKKVFSDLQREV